LYAHRCIGLKQWQTHNVFWKFKNGINQDLQLDLPFSLLFNTYSQLKQAVLAHAGIAYIPKILIQEELENRQIMAILTDRCISLPGFYIHYLERMKDNDILSLLITALYQYGQQLRRN
jgi:DNA-binding transcriptional LysR family regulator